MRVAGVDDAPVDSVQVVQLRRHADDAHRGQVDVVAQIDFGAAQAAGAVTM